jgi:hypothetical protein
MPNTDRIPIEQLKGLGMVPEEEIANCARDGYQIANDLCYVDYLIDAATSGNTKVMEGGEYKVKTIPQLRVEIDQRLAGVQDWIDNSVCFGAGFKQLAGDVLQKARGELAQNEYAKCSETFGAIEPALVKHSLDPMIGELESH